MRGYGEQLEVHLDAGERPVTFRWRRRQYRVSDYLGQWRMRTSWWKQRAADGALYLEVPVWRVEAVARAHRGVFELAGGMSGWTLLSVLD